MTDFNSVLRRAIDNLPENTVEARRQLYARAETTLVAQLQKGDPPADAARIAHMRESLRAAAKNIEAQEGKRQPAARPAAARPQAAPTQAARPQGAPAQAPRPAAAAPRPIPGAPGYVSPLRQRQGDPAPAARASVPPPPQPAPMPPVAARPEPPQPAATQPPPAYRDEEPAYETDYEADYDEPAYADDDDVRGGGYQDAAPAFDDWPESNAYDLEPRRRPWGWIIALLVLGALAGVGYWKRDQIMDAAAPLIALIQNKSSEEEKVDARLSDADGQAGQDQPAASPPADTPQPSQPAPGLIEAMLVEEGETPQALPTEIPGSVKWLLKRQDGAAYIEGNVEIPSRSVKLTLMIHKNTDPAFPATHTIDFIFEVPAEFGGGGINNVPGLLAKSTPKARGGPLAGEVVRVDDGIFLMALLAGPLDAPRNAEALAGQPFLDVPVIYANGHRAIITLAKGPEGEKVFADAFGEWNNQ